jgi:hypothetical protein
VPAETIRLQRRLTTRDRWCVALVAGGAVVGSLCVGLASAGSSGPAAHAGPCVSLVRPFAMGGATFHRCGSDAVAFCASNRTDETIALHCREAGIRVRH